MSFIKKFHHPALYVPKEKMEQTISFYEKVFGYKLYYRGRHKDTNYVHMLLGEDTWLEIEDVSDMFPELHAKDRALYEDTAYIVNDIEDFIIKAQTGGAKLTFGPEHSIFAEEKDVLIARIKAPCGEDIVILEDLEEKNL